jgi:tetratricopeptide (TPR) repeat protein
MRYALSFRLLVLLMAASCAWVGAQSRETLWFGMSGGADIPLFGAGRYLQTGGAAGVLAGARIPSLEFLVTEVEIGGGLQPVTGTSGTLLTGVSALARVGVEFPQGSPFSGSAYGMGGYVQGILIGAQPFSSVTAGSIFGGGGLAAKLRLSDSWSVVAGVEAWTAAGLGPFIRGSLGARFHPVLRNLKPLAYELRNLSSLQFSGLSVANLFPVLYEYYENRPMGRVTITNNSQKTITDLKVFFFVDGYMKAPTPCPSVARLAPGATATVEVNALFSEKVLEVTEQTRITAKLSFDYAVEVWELHQETTVPLNLHARNEITWDDDRKAAAFVSSRDPAVLQFGRNTATWVEDVGAEAVNWNLRMAMGIWEALRLYGMTYVADTTSPYEVKSKQTGAVDFLQFPRETLKYTTGDCDDLSILYCSLLQSLNIDTAFITVPGHIYAAVSLGLSPEDAKRIFSRPDDLVYSGTDTWLPVEITALGSSFIEAWALGASEWREASKNGTEGFYPVRAAWEEYKPVGFPGEQVEPAMPSMAAFQTVYGRGLSGYVTQEIQPLVKDLKAAIASARDKAPPTNKLGVLYARYGLADDALEQFNQALRTREYVPAMVNKANLLFLEGSSREALIIYQRVLVVQPETPSALLGLARCYHALRNYARVAEPYEKLRKVNPDLAAKYPYLDPGQASSTRAAEAGGSRMTVWEYGE